MKKIIPTQFNTFCNNCKKLENLFITFPETMTERHFFTDQEALVLKIIACRYNSTTQAIDKYTLLLINNIISVLIHKKTYFSQNNFETKILLSSLLVLLQDTQMTITKENLKVALNAVINFINNENAKLTFLQILKLILLEKRNKDSQKKIEKIKNSILSSPHYNTDIQILLTTDFTSWIKLIEQTSLKKNTLNFITNTQNLKNNAINKSE